MKQFDSLSKHKARDWEGPTKQREKRSRKKESSLVFILKLANRSTIYLFSGVAVLLFIFCNALYPSTTVYMHRSFSLLTHLGFALKLRVQCALITHFFVFCIVILALSYSFHTIATCKPRNYLEKNLFLRSFQA